jgi:two-component system, chemotaxis family, response regulator Rcp1
MDADVVRDSPTKHDADIIILLVEDNPGDAALFSTAFENCQFPVQIRVATDGEVALDYLFLRGKYAGMSIPDVVLLDINLPKKNGFEVLAEMRRHPVLEGIPVFMISGSKNKADILKSQAMNAAAFLSKPMDLEGFEALATSLLSIEFPRVLEKKGCGLRKEPCERLQY